MRAALRDPRWLAGLAVAVVFALACVWLAQWQLDRRVARAERNAAVLENYDAAPAPLADVLTDPAAELGVAGEWQPVALRGRYDDERTVLVRNRPQGGSNGYLVTTPFVVADPGTTVLLVRGWLPSGADASSPGAVPPAPAGQVDVLARLRAAEPTTTRQAPAGQAYRVAPVELLAGASDPAAGTAGGATVTGAYGVVATEAGGAPAGLAPVPRPDTDPGPHLAYGVQWYLFALAGLGIWVVLARRHAGEQAERATASGAGGPDRGDGTGPDGPPDGAGPGGPRARGGSGRGAREDWVYEPGR
ncbi:SURF1 family protein [Jannaschia sp. R86511]|uniref:SURF1 family cytochrome oxidase biogenesis protein n=1 Tax=Jannaschia sp. R86511 TaxID=3093853 RepID=UPI0036D26A51